MATALAELVTRNPHRTCKRPRSPIWETEPILPPTPRSRPFGLLAPASHKRWVAVKLRFSLRFLSVLCVSALKRIPQTVTESRARSTKPRCGNGLRPHPLAFGARLRETGFGYSPITNQFHQGAFA